MKPQHSFAHWVLIAELEARIKGVRGLHNIDVHVKGTYHNIEFNRKGSLRIACDFFQICEVADGPSWDRETI